MRNFFILLFSLVCLMSGCNQIDSLQQVDEDDCLVSFNFVGEITSSDTPMTKASTNDLYLVQVGKGNGPTETGINIFCAGVFNSPSDINIKLKKGTSYRIVISMIKNGMSLLENRINGNNNSILTRYYNRPDTFSWHFMNSSWDVYLPLNTLFYASIGYNYYLTSDHYTNEYKSSSFEHSGWSSYRDNFFNIGYAVLDNDKYILCDDWFYGEASYSPTGNYETIPFVLKRAGFKLKYELIGVTDGEVNVKVYKDGKTLIDNTTSASSYSSDPVFYAFYDIYSAWLYADDYIENFTLAVSWKRGYGENVVEDYGTKTIQIKRNCLNNIKIQMTSADQNAGMNLTVESESSIGADAVTIPVE